MGPLKGIKVIEIAGLGPAPVTGMILADLGAEVILVERKGNNPNAALTGSNAMDDAAFFKRGKQSIALDLKKPEAVALVLALVGQADVLIEGFRPGVMERLGLGPQVCFEANRELVYGRMTGWGQSGPLAQSAGHDINYLAITGALHHSSLPGDLPYPTPTLVGDIGGGAMSLALGITSALLHACTTGQGQVIDAAICDGTIYNMTLMASLCEQGVIKEERGSDFFSAASPWCNTYVCADGRSVTVQALEPNFYAELITLCGFADDPDFAQQHNANLWPAAKQKMTELFASQAQAHWCELLEGSDACFAPVLTLAEAAEHPHNQARANFVKNGEFVQPAAAPKFSQTQQELGAIPSLGEHTEALLQQLKLSTKDITALEESGAI